MFIRREHALETVWPVVLHPDMTMTICGETLVGNAIVIALAVVIDKDWQNQANGSYCLLLSELLTFEEIKSRMLATDLTGTTKEVAYRLFGDLKVEFALPVQIMVQSKPDRIICNHQSEPGIVIGRQDGH